MEKKMKGLFAVGQGDSSFMATLENLKITRKFCRNQCNSVL